MTIARSISIIVAVAATAIGTSACATTDLADDPHHPDATADSQITQAAPAVPGSPGMGQGGMAGVPGYARQMQAMQAMHDKMVAARTPQERQALMAEQMKVMQNGMGMMGRMGPGPMAGRPDDWAARQGMMEQRMDMMQSMMQMMMDRLPEPPATK